jgi:CTP synthase (UTP-ammonia lyase)
MPLVSMLLDRHVAGPYEARTVDAIEHARRWLDAPVEVRVIPTKRIDEQPVVDESAGVVIGPGSPYDNPEGVHAVIRSARERGVPLVGT